MNEQVVIFPAASRAVIVIVVVVPSANVDPLGISEEIEVTPRPSKDDDKLYNEYQK